MIHGSQQVAVIAAAALGSRGIAAMGLLSAGVLVVMFSDAELRRVGQRHYTSRQARTWRRWVVAVSLSVFIVAVVVQIIRLLP